MESKKVFQEIEDEIKENWGLLHNFFGIRRRKLENLSKGKAYKVRKAIASMRRRKIITLRKRYYFIDLSKV